MEHLEQLRHAGLFEARVPRYTSYPPANRFPAVEGMLHQRQWLNIVPCDAQLSIYIHIPFCAELCRFCACRTQVLSGARSLERYLDCLKREIALARNELPSGVHLSRVYIGGGTPTLLSADMMRSLFGALFSAFPPDPQLECCVEIDAACRNDRLIEELFGLGMTRAIVGVQDFDPDVQNAIGRRLPFDKALSTIKRLKQSGLRHISMEMLYGLPCQTLASVAETTQKVLALEPDRLSVCEYAHIPHVAKRQFMIDSELVPDGETAFLMSQTARRILAADGYEPVGIDHFVKPQDSLLRARANGDLRRDFLGYSDDTSHALIGLGASAISRFPQGYTQNASATSLYVKAVSDGYLPAYRGYQLTGTDRALAHMIGELMCRFEINLDDMAMLFPASVEVVSKATNEMAKHFAGFVERGENTIRIIPCGRPMARVMSHFLDRVTTPTCCL